jgi:hypothetical protein
MLALKDFAADDDHDNVSDDKASRSIDEMNDGNSDDSSRVRNSPRVGAVAKLPATTARGRMERGVGP